MEVERQIEKQRSKKIKVEHEGDGFLPEDIVREILSRLPVKNLLRYMSVSRHWKSLISNNSFKKLHRQKTINKNNPPSVLVLHSSNKNSYVLTTFDLYGKVIQQWSPPKIPSTTYIRMLTFPIQSKLVCFLSSDKFYLCNPSTRRLYSLPDPRCKCLRHRTCMCGFAYVPSKDEYVILHSYNGNCEILSISISNDDDQLHYGSWRSVDHAKSIDHDKCSYSFGVFVRGTFYWMMCDKDEVKYVILSFNMENECFSTIGLPKDFEDRLYFYPSLEEIKGELYFMGLSYSVETLTVWMLSDDKSQLWTQSWSIDLQSNLWWIGSKIHIFIYIREYLENHDESYKNFSSIWTGKIFGVGIHTSIFSL